MEKILMLSFGIIVIILAANYVQCTDYCNRDLCKIYQNINEYQYLPHIACNTTNRFSNACPSNRFIVPMFPKYKRIILDSHNRLRNFIASGNFKGYDAAVRMPMMRWDNELAYLAELKVKTCEFAHDKCRNTDTYKYAGQNLAIFGSYPKRTNDYVAIKSMMTGWINESKDCSMDYINHWRSHDDAEKQIGHFTAMVQDKNIAVGCAMVRYANGNQQNVLVQYVQLACDYSFTNVQQQPVYRTGGRPCSKCTSGCNAHYKNLCDINETVIPLPDPIQPTDYQQDYDLLDLSALYEDDYSPINHVQRNQNPSAANAAPSFTNTNINQQQQQNSEPTPEIIDLNNNRLSRQPKIPFNFDEPTVIYV